MTGAREYHERTKHSPRGISGGGRRMNFDNKPTPYKVYEDLPTRDLAERVRPPRIPALSAVAESGPDGAPGRERSVDLDALTQLCYYAAGVTKRIERRGRELLFRAAACTGALYHVDLYAVCGDLGGGASDDDGLPAGVYHFDPMTLSLDVLREGDFRGVLAKATEGGLGSREAASGVLADASAYESVAEAPVTFVATSTWWRNAWKYGDRTFRHAFWDSGTALANLLAVAHALDLRAEAVLGFADDPVAELLGVDPTEEAPLELVPVGAGDPAPDAPAVDPIDPETAPLSPDPKDDPLIREAWQAGTLEDGAAAREWREEAAPAGTRPAGDGERVALDPVDSETESERPLRETILRRGSCRSYERDEISFRTFSTVLDRATRGAPLDVRDSSGAPLRFVDPHLIVSGVEGLDPGSYRYHPDAGELELLRAGEFRREAGHLALDQQLAADAAACVYFLTDLDAVVDALGDRGYRAAQFEASLTAGRLYLATYAHRDLGGTGLTFYDDVVSDFFSPPAAGQTPTFLYTLGRPE